MVVRFDDNACALIGKNGEPLGTRINGEFIKGIRIIGVMLIYGKVLLVLNYGASSSRRFCH